MRSSLPPPKLPKFTLERGPVPGKSYYQIHILPKKLVWVTGQPLFFKYRLSPLWVAFPSFVSPNRHPFLRLRPRMLYKPQSPDGLWVSDFYGTSIHTKLNLFFSCLSYVNLIIRITKEPRKEEGRTLPPLHFLQRCISFISLKGSFK